MKPRETEVNGGPAFPRPQTATEALRTWREGDKYLGDDPMMTLEDMWASAHRTLQLAKTDGIALEELVPDEFERQKLIDDAKEFNRNFDLEDPSAV